MPCQRSLVVRPSGTVQGGTLRIASCQTLEISLPCFQGAKKAIGHAISTARANGATVALTTGDPGLVARHRDEFWEQINSGSVDVLFANRCEV